MHEVMQYGSKNIEYTTIGVMPANFEMNRYTIESGRALNDVDMNAGNRVCVIGSTVVEQMFKDVDPIGKIVKIRDDYFTVVGVLTMFGTIASGSSSSEDNPLAWKNRRVLIPPRPVCRGSWDGGVRATGSRFPRSRGASKWCPPR